MSIVLYTNMSNADYHAHSAVSSSQLKTIISQSLAHFAFKKNNPTPQTEAMIFGSAYHSFVLEPNNFSDEYFVFNDADKPVPDKDYRTKENQIWKAQIYADNAHKTVLSLTDLQKIQAMSEVIRSNPFCDKLLNDCPDREHSVFAHHEDMSVRIRPDAYSDKLILDFKTCEDASPDGFERTLINYRYYLQAAFYVDVMKLVDGKVRDFILIAQEKSAPYIAQIYVVSDVALERGREEYKHALKLLKQAYRTREFPAYESAEKGGIREITLPDWVLRKELAA